MSGDTSGVHRRFASRTWCCDIPAGIPMGIEFYADIPIYATGKAARSVIKFRASKPAES
jgi:hypothetical protein